MKPLEILKDDVASRGIALERDAWDELCAKCSEVFLEKGEVIFEMASTPISILFVTEGIASANMHLPDGRTFIYRFFEARQMCTTISSAWESAENSDSITCVTNLTGVMMPLDYWHKEYMAGHTVGSYFRLKAIETLLFDKGVIRVKTLNRTDISYKFLEEQHTNVIPMAPKKIIAQFLGITPEGLSRFLKERRRSRSGA